ncbi:formate dehydrogenase subunit alpha [Shewanella waksmanii]|uniref:formate dehydrogenase subunit alpha n=1 Tax=Shewanella waksmanii TaxID=213783 RepID=UPI0037358616
MIKFTLDGQSILAKDGESILSCAKRHNIDIPNLCDHNGHKKQSCGLCVVELQQNHSDVSIVKACETPAAENCQVTSQSSQLTAQRQQALSLLLQDHFADCEAPCQQACPAGVDVQAYLHHISQGDHRQAIKVIKQTLPLPLSIGRVCPAFCESACRRSAIDEPVAIRQLKRHAADIDALDDPYVPPRMPLTDKKVAIIGSGPAGISAGFYLSNNGHDVDIFESMPAAGGWLRYGIPEYRLPKAILDKEIDILSQNGLKIHLNTALGKQIHLEQLVQDYDAVCLAIGAQKAVPMDYPGSELDGCFLGVDYLKDHCTEQQLKLGKKVAVIGGGNTAIDCARTAIRQGAEVTLVYRRTREEMPAEVYEIDEAEFEGVEFYFLTNPVKNHADTNGRVNAITFEKMALGEPDSSGRRRPVSTGETFTEYFDTVIPAVSQTPDMAFLNHPDSQLSTGDVALTRWNTFEGCQHTMSAGVEKLFVLGDSRTGPATAIAAVADGKKAADAIEKLLKGELSCELSPKPYNSIKAKNQSLTAQHFNHEASKPRAKPIELSAKARRGNFNEVELDFNFDQALEEAQRCLSCGCQANTQCNLRNYATQYQIAPVDNGDSHARQFIADNSSPFIEFDANRCISCGACVDACHQQSGHKVICFEENHFHGLPGNSNRQAPRVGFKATMADSQCVQCGNCVQVCPTGALSDARANLQGQKSPLKTTSTICTYCGVGCRLNLHVDESLNKVVHVTGDKDSAVNQGMLCVKGRFGFDFINDSQRIQSPMLRIDGKLTPVSWPRAIEYIATGLGDIKQEYGSDAIAGLASAKATNEDNYLFQKFMRSIIGTNNIDHCARLCHASTVTALYDALGSGAMTNDISSIDQADLIFIIGSDTTNAHPIIASRIKQSIAKHGARLIVADPKQIDIADDGLLYVAQRPGTDVMLLNAIMQQIIANDWHDLDYLAARVDGYSELYEAVMHSNYSPENAEKVTGIAASDIAEMAKLIGTAEKTAVFYAMGITQHTSGHDNVTAIANLQMLCGNIGIEGAGINPLRGQSNVQGACDMGALPNYFSGYQKIDDPLIQMRFRRAWGNEELPHKVGLAATEMMHALSQGTLQALYVMGENPVLSDPDQAHVIAGLTQAKLVIVQDIFMTETAQLADVVLPAFSFAEKVGHFTNTERRVQQLQAAVKPPKDSKADWQIITDIANQMGANWPYQTEQQIWHEITEVTPQYRGITWSAIDPNNPNGHMGIQWPCPAQGHPGTPTLHTQKFTRGRGVMRAVEYRQSAEQSCSEYPLTLSTGRLLAQFHTGTLSRKTQGLNDIAKPQVMISVADAEQLGINNGDMLKLTSRRGEITISAFVTKRAQVGVLFLPFHFAEAAANKLTNNALDPVAKIPEFKVCAVKAEKIELRQPLSAI